MRLLIPFGGMAPPPEPEDPEPLPTPPSDILKLIGDNQQQCRQISDKVLDPDLHSPGDDEVVTDINAPGGIAGFL